jgi:hypothetical protein
MTDTTDQLNLVFDAPAELIDSAPVRSPRLATIGASEDLHPNEFVLPGVGRVRTPGCVAPHRHAPGRLKRVIDEVYSLTHDRRCFATCCNIWWATLQRLEGGESVYMELIADWPDEAVRVAKKGFDILVEHFTCDGGFDDILGQTYMMIRSDWGGSVLGQYFTPWPIARLMTQLTAGALDTARLEGGPAVELYDPACGSAVMLLAARAHIASTFGRRALRNVRCYGQDVDRLCCTMANIQLAMSNVPWMLSLMAATHAELAAKSRS